jgi:hypothetical protein
MRPLGIILLLVSIIGFILYAYILFASDYSILILKLTVLALIGVITMLFAFIGLNMMRTKER